MDSCPKELLPPSAKSYGAMTDEEKEADIERAKKHLRWRLALFCEAGGNDVLSSKTFSNMGVG